MDIKRCCFIIIFSTIFILPLNNSLYGYDPPHFPRLANYFLQSTINDKEVEILPYWDLLILCRRVDNSMEKRERLKLINELNPDILMLIYTSAMDVHVEEDPPSPLAVACEEYDWWLRDYEGNTLNSEAFPWTLLINHTNTEAASGNHPDGKKSNEFLPEWMINDHVHQYDFWDGIFYDVFSDNIAFIHPDIKDATRNEIPEYDWEHNGDEPIFSDLWKDGMLTVLDNTIALDSNVIIVGNGLHKGALERLNGKMKENFSGEGSQNMHMFAPNHQYLAHATRTPRISIINGHMTNQDPTNYQRMRYTLCATLMTDNYYSCDFGSRHHGETIWYDEYSIKPEGYVDAKTTRLTEDIDSEVIIIPVESTLPFKSSGIIEIEGEQIYYESKDETHFLGCYRGFPRRDKYDLRAPHSSGSTVIQHLNNHKGYLGYPLGSAYDVNNPSIRLDDLLEDAGWIAEGDEKEAINSRAYRRDFDNGTVLVNPTDNSVLVYGLGDKIYSKIAGIQDPVHNDGLVIHDTLRVNPKDGYVLIWISETDTIPPQPPEGIRIGGP